MEANTTQKTTMADLVARIDDLQTQIKALEAKVSPARNEAQREMTDADARNILIGDHRLSKHKDAAAALGLSYGQIYSCRLEHTFKAIHKEIAAAGLANPWVK